MGFQEKEFGRGGRGQWLVASFQFDIRHWSFVIHSTLVIGHLSFGIGPRRTRNGPRQGGNGTIDRGSAVVYDGPKTKDGGGSSEGCGYCGVIQPPFGRTSGGMGLRPTAIPIGLQTRPRNWGWNGRFGLAEDQEIKHKSTRTPYVF
jgi:hypothetical protein